MTAVEEGAYANAELLPTRYLRFQRIPKPGRKTMVWAIVSQSSGVKLGEIRWHAPWRQYCFYPSADTIFNMECMDDICDRIDTLMRWRTNVRRNLSQGS